MSMNCFGDTMVDYMFFLLIAIIIWKSGKF